jgi:hypothetical protein
MSPTDLAATSTDTAASAFIAILSDPAVAALVLAAVAARTGNKAFAAAAGTVRAGNVGGRAMMDDSAALARMSALLADGVADSPQQAGRFVARTMSGEISTDAAALRIARKFRAAAANNTP